MSFYFISFYCNTQQVPIQVSPPKKNKNYNNTGILKSEISTSIWLFEMPTYIGTTQLQPIRYLSFTNTSVNLMHNAPPRRTKPIKKKKKKKEKTKGPAV